MTAGLRVRATDSERRMARDTAVSALIETIVAERGVEQAGRAEIVRVVGTALYAIVSEADRLVDDRIAADLAERRMNDHVSHCRTCRWSSSPLQICRQLSLRRRTTRRRWAAYRETLRLVDSVADEYGQ